MKRARLLFFYQLLTGLSDTITGALLVFAPALTLRLMHVSSPQDLLSFLTWAFSSFRLVSRASTE